MKLLKNYNLQNYMYTFEIYKTNYFESLEN